MSPASLASFSKSALASAVLVTDQAVRGHLGGVEVDLDLHVLGDGHERAAKLANQHAMGLVGAVDVGVVAISLVGKGLQVRILEIARAEAEHGQEDFTLCFFLDQLDQLVALGDAKVEITVGGQDDPVDAILVEMVGRDLVGDPDSVAGVGAAGGLKLIDLGEDLDPMAGIAGGRGKIDR